MRTYTTIWALLLLAVSPAPAQKMADLARKKPLLKLSLVPLVHIDNSFMLGTEIPLGKGRVSLQPEIGYGVGSGNLWYENWNRESPDKTTVQSKLQFRSYYKDGSTFRSYYGFEYAYRQSTYRQSDLGNSSQPLFGKTIDLRRTTHFAHGFLGWQGYFGNRLVLDFQVGLGLRKPEIKVLTDGLTAEQLATVSINERDWLNRSRAPGKYGPYPALMGAVQIGFVLGKIEQTASPNRK